MRWSDIKKSFKEELGAASKAPRRPLDHSLVQFIEALAIADARRDHLALSDPITRQEAGAQRVRQAGALINVMSSHLREILD
jgi:hypothetical protein